ncbi:hypothetical protein MKQ70_12230 [Chitinophaga sedimenti]|uniref:hypothetical protein n=1 Tax=Chitinophaga sedimenti TaxID=2033606 RepID=UPI002002FC50|nr:hypothetical protein [Chitinophaga sedimenti]MCK7555743.1 hypothetical protein [Chitinophaga sedimenti]
MQRLQRFGKEETVKSRETVAANKAASTQRFLLNEIRKTVLEAKLYLQKGLDTTAIAREVEEARRDMQTAREGILTDPGPFQTLRDLKVSAIILSQLLLHMEQQRRQLDNYTNQLMKYRETIDSLTGHDELLAFPNDSVALVKYLTKIVVIGKDASPVDSGIKQSLFSVQDLQTKVDLIEYELNANIEQVNNLRRSLASTTFDRELPAQRTSFSRVFAFSWKKDKLALRHYLAYNYMWILLLLLGIFTSWRFLTTLRARVSDKEANELVVRRPLLSAIIIITSLFQFFLPDPPFLVNLLFWAVPAICLIFVFAGHISAFWLRFWIIIVVLFLLASADNLLLQASDTERKIIAILAALGTICGAFHLVPRWRPVLREPRIVYFILFLTLMEAASLVFNIGGRYNLAKIFMTCGYFGMVLAILFLWTARLINEGLAVASAVYKQPDKHLFFINFERVGGRAPSILYAALIAGWFVLVARNFYIYTRISSPIVSFIREQRTIGEYTFSIQGMLIFLTILACSMFLSRLISFCLRRAPCFQYG